MIDPTKQQPSIRIRPGPNDSNARGDVFGGWLMSQIDVAASVEATAAAKGMTATRAVKDLTFLKPIYTYDLVSFYTEVVATGRTSITVKVEVFVQRMNAMSDPQMGEMIKVSDATLVFVAINKPGEARVLQT